MVMKSLKRHAALLGITMAILALAYAIAIAESAGALTAVHIATARLFVGGIAVSLSLPVIGLIVLVAIRWDYFSRAWQVTDRTSRAGLMALLAADIAAATAGWIAFFLVASP
jgi:hypothetical protein